MPTRTILRCLIAVNWTVAGLSFALLIYGHPGFRHSVAHRWATERMSQDAPNVPRYSDEYWRQFRSYYAEFNTRTDSVGYSGYWGWGIATVCAAVTAIGLMAVFPKVAPDPSDDRPPPPVRLP